MLNTQALAANIRKYRKLKGMTQTELAAGLYLTAQTISKWETGIAIPDLENLCRLADQLEVSEDLLLHGRLEPLRPAFIAVDGGGTKTEFVLFRETGEVIRRLVLSGSNPNVIGLSESCKILKQGIDILLSDGMEVSGVFAGIAGSATGRNAQMLTDFLKKAYPHIKHMVDSDIISVMHSVRGHDRCLAAICGTGSVVYANDGHTLHRAGGWGYLFDGAGSGFDIGRDALNHCLQWETGLCAETELTRRVTQKLGGSALEKLDVIYARGKDYIASFAPLVFSAYHHGDATAEAILQCTVSRIAVLVNTLHSRYFCGDALILAGGLTENREVFHDLLGKKLHPDIQIVFPELPPIYGACLQCMKLFGVSPYDEAKFDEAFHATYEAIKADAPQTKGELSI